VGFTPARLWHGPDHVERTLHRVKTSGI